jgi:hypothetical protein
MLGSIRSIKASPLQEAKPTINQSCILNADPSWIVSEATTMVFAFFPYPSLVRNWPMLTLIALMTEGSCNNVSL